MTLVNTSYAVDAPVYRYYTVDLLTDKILSEIPFGSVKYGRAVKGAGSFSGTIPVLPTEHSRSMNLYESTMPGNTGLYVMRNGVCVWGGIIWSRSYDIVGRKLSVSASEFTSYFHHRRIWKTWSHQFGAKVLSGSGLARVVFNWGAAADLHPGSSVKMEFYEPADWKYNGHYIISSNPAPTEDEFYIDGALSTVTVLSVERSNGVVSVQTDGGHNFKTGDVITISLSDYTMFNGTFAITVDSSNTDRFTYTLAGADRGDTKVTGKATRPLPNGIWENVTVSVRADTYDYIRSLVSSVFDDFTGIDFPNEYIEPGIAYRVPVVNKSLSAGLATITTANPHGLAMGQSVRVLNVGPLYDGEVKVVDAPTDTTFRFEASGIETPGAVAPRTATIIAREVSSREATLTTQSPHGFKVGQRVSIDSGLGPEGQEAVFNGVYTIKSIPTPTTFRYEVPSNITIPPTSLVQPTVTLNGVSRDIIRKELTNNTVRLTTRQPHGYAVNNVVQVSNLVHKVPIVEKELNVVQGEATIATVGPHGLGVGDVATITGFSDVFSVTEKTVTNMTATPAAVKNVTMKTSTPHKLSVNQEIVIAGMDDVYVPKSYSITSNVATVTLATNHNIPNGSSVSIANSEYVVPITSGELIGGSAIISMASTTNIEVGDIVDIITAPDYLANEVTLVRVDKGTVTLTLKQDHNFAPSDKVVVSNLGIGAVYEGDVSIKSVTANTISYDLTVTNREDINVAERRTSGHLLYQKGFYVGKHTVEGVSSTAISFSMKGKDMPKRAFSGVVGTMKVPARINGTYTTTGSTATTITFALTKPNQSTITLTVPEKVDDPGPTLSMPSVFNNAHEITAITPTTFTFTHTLSNTVPTLKSNGSVTVESIFNGGRTVTAVPTVDTFRVAIAGQSGVRETVSNMKAYVSTTVIFNGSYIVKSVDPTTNSFTYTKTRGDVLASPTSSYGSASVEPVIIAGSYGPYPGNSNIDIEFSTQGYSGRNVPPVAYRGFELANAGQALDSYSDTIDGFEYRIDCIFDQVERRFRRVFVLIPIDFPNPPAAGEVSPISRFGADKLVFEYPGNINNVKIDESAENTATRFFAVGENDLGPEAGPPFSVAAADDLLNGKDGQRRWPLLDDDEKVSDINDETVLYAHAKRYLSESRPPNAKLTVSVNGSLSPIVGSYSPGDWCSLVVDDEFLHQRLLSDLEPRDTVIVRKIDAYEVSVPDGTTFPETVSLTLVPEWEVDKRG